MDVVHQPRGDQAPDVPEQVLRMGLGQAVRCAEHGAESSDRARQRPGY